MGPFLARGAINLRVQPKEMTFLQKRYLAAASVSVENSDEQPDGAGKYDPDVATHLLSDKNMSDFIDEALSGAKSEPSYTAE